jgi:hypothetical protein
MPVLLEVTFRDMSTSDAVIAAAQRWANRLGKLDPRIQRCSVVVDRPHQRHRQGQQFHIRIELARPDQTITVTRDPGLDGAHEDIYVALADAFRAARRQLQDHTQIRRGDVKAHA